MLQKKYEIVRQIGDGAESHVYEARMSLPRGKSHPVAIKVTRPEHRLNETALELSTREAMTALRLCHNHPNLVTVFDFDQTRDGRLYCVMEYVDGVTVRDIRRGDMDSADRFFAIVRRIARSTLFALTHLHASGVIHRDVKPGNILLGRDGSVKLADLGISKRLDSGRSERFRGTFAYSSPEALRNGAPSVSWDLFSIGVTLYELITGRLPFGGHGPEEVLNKSMDGAPPLPDDTPDDLAGLVDGLLAYAQADRAFASADDCVRYLMHGEAVAATEEMSALVEHVAARARVPEAAHQHTFPDLVPQKTRSWLAWAFSSAAAAALMVSLGLNGYLLFQGSPEQARIADNASVEPIECELVITPPTNEPVTVLSLVAEEDRTDIAVKQAPQDKAREMQQDAVEHDLDVRDKAPDRRIAAQTSRVRCARTWR